jgi:hypothetical protein
MGASKNTDKSEPAHLVHQVVGLVRQERQCLFRQSGAGRVGIHHLQKHGDVLLEEGLGCGVVCGVGQRGGGEGPGHMGGAADHKNRNNSSTRLRVLS